MKHLYLLVPASAVAALNFVGIGSAQDSVPRVAAGACILKSLETRKPSNVDLFDPSKLVNKDLNLNWTWLVVKGTRECQSGSFKILADRELYTPLGYSIKGNCSAFAATFGGKHIMRDDSNRLTTVDINIDGPQLDPPPAYGINPSPRFLFKSHTGELCLLFAVPKTAKELSLSINDAPEVSLP